MWFGELVISQLQSLAKVGEKRPAASQRARIRLHQNLTEQIFSPFKVYNIWRKLFIYISFFHCLLSQTQFQYLPAGQRLEIRLPIHQGVYVAENTRRWLKTPGADWKRRLRAFEERFFQAEVLWLLWYAEREKTLNAAAEPAESNASCQRFRKMLERIAARNILGGHSP